MKTRSSSRLILCLLAANVSLLLVIVYRSSHGYVAPGEDRNRLRQWTHVNKDNAASFWSVATITVDEAIKEHKCIGGEAMSRPCCVSWGPGRVDCFVRGLEGHVRHWWKENGQEHDWDSLCGTAVGDVECVSRKEGHIDLMVVGSNNALWTKTYNGRWGEWTSRGGRIMDTPSCYVRSSTTVGCTSRSGTNTAAYIQAINDTWGAYIGLGYALQYPVMVLRRRKGLDLFGMNGHNDLIETWHSGEGFVSWHFVTKGPFKGRLATDTWTSIGSIFVLDMANRLKRIVWTGSIWLPPEDLGGSFKDVPSCVSFNTTIHCFGISTESDLYRRSYKNGTWSKWTASSLGPFQDTPSCIITGQNEISCYVQDYHREYVEIVYGV